MEAIKKSVASAQETVSNTVDDISHEQDKNKVKKNVEGAADSAAGGVASAKNAMSSAADSAKNAMQSDSSSK